MIEVVPTPIEGLLEIRTPRFGDERGFFSETWNAQVWEKAGISTRFVQDNHVLSKSRGVLRGLHFQVAPMAQDKLVRVGRGSIFDVAVDIRAGSATYGRWFGLVLSAQDWNQLLVPSGFAHGYLTLEPDTEVLYKVSAAYAPEHERAIRFDDPAIGIDWPIDPAEIIIADRDRDAPTLAELMDREAKA